MLAQAAGHGSANNLAGSGYNNKMNSFTTQNNPGTIKAYNLKWCSPSIFWYKFKIKWFINYNNYTQLWKISLAYYQLSGHRTLTNVDRST